MSEVCKTTINSAPGSNGTWCTAIVPNTQHSNQGTVNISIQGSTWSGTVTLQRKFSDEDDYFDVDNFTSNTESSFTETEKAVKYRLGIKNGNYTSGSVKVRLSQ